MGLVLLTAVAKDQLTTDCVFEIAINGGALAPADTSVPGTISAQVPDSAQQIEIRATPTAPDYWPLIGQFQVQADGSLVAADAPAEFAPPRSADAGGPISLVVYLSQVRDATAPALASLAQVPPNRTGEIPASWPPVAWDAPELADLNTIGDPLAAGSDLSIEQQTLAPQVEGLVLEVKNVTAPQAIAVSWPDAVERTDGADPTPFLIYFHPNVGQNAPPYYTDPNVGTYPFGFDYVYYGLWRYMNFVGDPLTVDPYAKGLPYQMAASGKNAVIILPSNKVGPEVGVFQNAAAIDAILREIQAFMFRRKGVYTAPELGRTAMASFSAGNELITAFLGQPANQSHPFYLNTLQELYMFDVAQGGADAWVAQASAWARRGDSASKMIRAYTQYVLQNAGQLLGATAPASVPFVTTSQDGLRSAAVLPSTVWNRAETAAGNANMATGQGSFQDTHQLISALMLTDALRRSGF